MPYSTSELIQLIAACTTAVISILGAIFAGWATVRAGRVEKKQDTLGGQQTELIHQVNVIEKQTNSQLNRLETRLEHRDEQIKQQHLAQLATQETARVQLAAAQGPGGGAPATPVPVVLTDHAGVVQPLPLQVVPLPPESER